MVNKKYWIKKAVKRPGALSRQLGIPVKKDIPITLLKKVIKARPGQVIKNPTMLGKRKLKVTRLMERRAILAINLKNIRKRKK